MKQNLHHYKCGITDKSQNVNVDPITTQIVRNSLNSAAEQMKRALCRTAMSPIIYDVLDFAGAIYDNKLRLLSQAPSLPLFMGTLNFCIEEAVKGIGGEEKLNDGDIITRLPLGNYVETPIYKKMKCDFLIGSIHNYSKCHRTYLDVIFDNMSLVSVFHKVFVYKEDKTKHKTIKLRLG